jgi:putative tryptophan/tyrosine transport system substrate-binding protein
MSAARHISAAMATLLLVAPVQGAQSVSKVHRIGYLMVRGPDAGLEAAFMRGLNELGYQEGRNIIIERRFADNKAEALPELAAGLARMNLDLVVVAPEQAAVAMKQAAPAVPIVMATAGEPVGTGVVISLARPGGTITGLSNVSIDIIGKQIQLLKQVIPGITRVAFLTNAYNLSKAIQLRAAQAAAQSLHVELVFEEAQGAADFERAFAAMAQARPGALVVAVDPLMFGERRRLAELAAKHRLPAISPFREFADAGGLMAYGGSLPDMFRRSAAYVDKILRGAKPAALPVEQPTLFEFAVNLATARDLGLKIPQTLLQRADRVIE